MLKYNMFYWIICKNKSFYSSQVRDDKVTIELSCTFWSVEDVSQINLKNFIIILNICWPVSAWERSTFPAHSLIKIPMVLLKL